MQEKESSWFDIIQTKIENDDSLYVAFGKKKEGVAEGQEIDDSQVDFKTFIKFPPQYLVPIINSFLGLGIEYQEKTKKYIGIGPKPDEENK